MSALSIHSLLVEAVDLPLAYEGNARAAYIMALISDAPTAGDTIDTWAAALHMSRRAFTRLFGTRLG